MREWARHTRVLERQTKKNKAPQKEGGEATHHLSKYMVVIRPPHESDAKTLQITIKGPLSPISLARLLIFTLLSVSVVPS
jgi:hypothetical protein